MPNAPNDIGLQEVDFLGFKIGTDGVNMQSRLFDAILEWPTPSSVRDVCSFIGMSHPSIYQGICSNGKTMLDFVRNKGFILGEEQAESFKTLKKSIKTAPVPVNHKAKVPFVVSTDASKYAVGATITQNGHPIAFLPHRLSDSETRLDTEDQELLAFMIALREWSVYLRGRKYK